MHIVKIKNIPFPFMYNVYANASNNTPFCTYINAYMIWRFHPRAQGEGKW